MVKGKLYIIISRVYWMLVEFGIDLLRMKSAFRGVIAFLMDKKVFKNEGVGGCPFEWALPRPCLVDRFCESGTGSGAYFHQDLWVAQRVFKNNPRRHIDVGSRVDGFVAHVAGFREIEVCDIRPLTTSATNIHFFQTNLIGELDESLVECCDSLSCLHALEHFGLGRYGDPVCGDGFLRGWKNLCCILKPGGTFYFAVPFGPARIEFNAHRVFSVEQLFQMVEGMYDVVAFSYVDDRGDLFTEQQLVDGLGNNFGCWFGCAILELRKR